MGGAAVVADHAQHVLATDPLPEVPECLITPDYIVSPSTILPFLGVSPRSHHPALPCAPSHLMPREELSFRGERHIPCRRSAPRAADLYRDKVARFQTPSHVHRSISKGFQWKLIAASVSRH
jgi:hypothetical protein